MQKNSIRVGKSFIIAVNEGNVNMTIAELTKRVIELEGQVKALEERARPFDRSSQDNWLAMAGIFKDDPVWDEINRLGREYRQSLRPGYKKTKAKKQVTKTKKPIGTIHRGAA